MKQKEMIFIKTKNNRKTKTLKEQTAMEKGTARFIANE